MEIKKLSKMDMLVISHEDEKHLVLSDRGTEQLVKKINEIIDSLAGIEKKLDEK